MPELTVIIPTYNEAQNIEKCLRSVHQLADEILVVDSYSTDNTLNIARQYTDKIIQQEYRYSASQKNRAIPMAAHEWILLLDADEWATEELREEIAALMKKDPPHTAYWIYRMNYFLDKRIRFSGWQNDKVIRLFKRDKCEYEDKNVHAELLVDGSTGKLNHKLGHNTFKSMDHFLSKINRYSLWSARDYDKKTGILTPFHFVIKPLFRFLKHYIFQLGILDGTRGFIISWLMAHGVRLRYIKLWILRKERSGSIRKGSADGNNSD